ncbi:LuxR C-terminal-related transcriptional regulator [Mucilaginibacter sp. BJC16-A38]|uniref:LuxR C-terminal-related transcriptional regulator n=1 Tax=Mucilaginibacter phenanthrenivorans TaxID=1234842 RepID=UPI00215730A0|nr:LuxR C-terminal-related transcriptional regulator [Mucilaginibacter phenanthrenivorans]MCR8557843.1 LuxR C-terminal-related transcriptional regulator [Mucilaginibacter phenanthrenivorans]
MNSKKKGADALLVSLRILNQIGASILSEFTIEQMIDTVYEHVNKLMDAYSFAIGIYNPVSERIEYIGARENNQKLPAFSIYAHNQERFSGWVFTHQKELLINDYEKEYLLYLPHAITPMQGINPASLMYIPLFINKEIIGLLSVRTLEKNAYGPQSMEILKTLAVFIAKAIENTRASNGEKPAPAEVPPSYHADLLSARELDVLSLLSKGFTNRAIADDLFISPNTVKTHTIKIYQKLQAGNRTEAIVKAKTYGLIK